MRERAETKLEDPQAKLERTFIEEYLKERGRSLSTVSMSAPGDRQLLTQAAEYAAVRLAEIDARAAYIHQIHGGTEHP
jgi:hypothetical protein